MEDIIHGLSVNLERMKYAGMISTELNNYMDLKSTLKTVIKYFSELTGCQAVGVRLHKDGDYPYYVYYGFSDLFILKENHLCANDKEGNPIPEPDGKGYLLDCMCGNVIRGRFNPELDFFSSGGSFWSNNTSCLLATTSEDDRQGRTRNYCNSCGYESVALIPIKTEQGNIGLVQLNDYRNGMFNESLIAYLELLASQIGKAVSNSMAYEELKHKETIDNLTGLYNRKYFVDQLVNIIKAPLRQNKGFYLLIVSLDRFKSINSKYGLQEGDRVLSEVSTILLTAFRKSDTVCRINGDEFGIIIDDGEADVEKICSRIRTMTENWIRSEPILGQLDISIGKARWEPDNPVSIDDFILNAELMMNAEKRSKEKTEREPGLPIVG